MIERDLFANFERVRREMEELFGDVFDRRRLAHRRDGFCPPVDVAYLTDPPRVIVTAELAGVAPDALELEIQGRRLILQGQRPQASSYDAVYQLVEIERGPFRRVIDLGADVLGDAARARYDDGMLRVELPLAEPAPRVREVPIEGGAQG
jgi:HSP20 family protein